MTYWYLATSYSKHPAGLDAAFRMAVHATGLLMRAGVPVYCPIAHSHPVATICEMDPKDHSIWLPVDQPLIDAAHGIIVLRDGNWEESFGIAHELECFRAAGKPVVFMDPGVVPELPAPAAPFPSPDAIEKLALSIYSTLEPSEIETAARAIERHLDRGGYGLNDCDARRRVPECLLYDLRRAIRQADAFALRGVE